MRVLFLEVRLEVRWCVGIKKCYDFKLQLLVVFTSSEEKYVCSPVGQHTFVAKQVNSELKLTFKPCKAEKCQPIVLSDIYCCRRYCLLMYL